MQWAAWGVAAVVAIAHLVAAGRYGFFVNELYFIVCGPVSYTHLDVYKRQQEVRPPIR